MLHVFDLDDTLLRYGRRQKFCVPRQTFHALRILKSKSLVISFNPFARLLVRLTGLSKYITEVECGDTSRINLMQNALANRDEKEIHYWDDRNDNLQAIHKYFPFIVVHHVSNPLTLYQQLQLFCTFP